MAIVCGTGVIVNGASTVARWMCDYTTDDGAMSASNIPAGTGRGVTIRDLKGRYVAYGHTPASFPGEQLDFVGSINSTIPALGGTIGIAATVRIRQADIIIPIESERPYIYHVVHFENDGTTITVGTAEATDATNPNPPTSFYGKVQFDDGGFTDENDVTNIVLRFTSYNRDYVTSSTVSNGEAYRQRCRGRLDANLIYQMYEGTPSAIPEVNDNLPCKVYVTNSTFWHIEDMRIRTAPSDYGPDAEGMKPVGGSVEAMWNAYSDGAGIGFIKDPAVATKWPYSA